MALRSGAGQSAKTENASGSREPLRAILSDSRPHLAFNRCVVRVWKAPKTVREMEFLFSSKLMELEKAKGSVAPPSPEYRAKTVGLPDKRKGLQNTEAPSLSRQRDAPALFRKA